MKHIEISKGANPNYLAKIVRLENLKPHENADRLQVALIDFQDVITGLDAQNGDIYVYFPVESKINKDFLSFTDSFRKKELNWNTDKAGFFEENCRVKAVKLRGHRSMGYMVPINTVEAWAGVNYGELNNYINEEFDMVGGKKILEKYIIKEPTERKVKQGKAPQLSRLVDGQVHLHVDTENLRRNADKIKPGDHVTISYKTHGTSFWVSNVIVKRKLTWLERLFKALGANISEVTYDLVYGSRKVVKNKSFEDPKGKNHFYGYDLWADIKDEIGHLIPKGFTIYGEMLGYDKNGSYIQKNYDYGCQQGQHKLEIYRITQTNSDGLVTELSHKQIKEFCDKTGLTMSHVFYDGDIDTLIRLRAKPTVGSEYGKLSSSLDDRDWQETLIKVLETDFNEKDCFMCTNKVPEEGICIRKESMWEYEVYKLKSFRFLEHETKELDEGITNIEDSQ